MLKNTSWHVAKPVFNFYEVVLRTVSYYLYVGIKYR